MIPFCQSAAAVSADGQGLSRDGNPFAPWEDRPKAMLAETRLEATGFERTGWINDVAGRVFNWQRRRWRAG